jgi:hypothetical protein
MMSAASLTVMAWGPVSAYCAPGVGIRVRERRGGDCGNVVGVDKGLGAVAGRHGAEAIDRL